eukprot:TRINITY_DN110900_c0_g1_i1.p1 TRINITY_DN110900_c0_g1~~TRINITY_DN110900_c0_g1_i1.p1  ORF type:complete len:309 (-),score=111.74 TRINITY_DN110900_c0_g1_i1:410-1336(-)
MATLHGDVASAIGQQVEQMILQAKKDSEARVRHELNVARNQLQQMEAHITDLSERVARGARSNGSAADPSQTVDRAFLSQKIQQLEQKWGSEVKALKQDLHRTILAHNHNSDLMRHHRDALDEARKKLEAVTQPKAEQVDAQIEKVDRMLRVSVAKQRALDALTERLTAMELQVAEMFPVSAGAGAFGGMMPPGIVDAGAASVEPKAAGKAKAKKDGAPPSEEEFRNRLLQAAGKAGASSTSFNAEAPVFIPGGAAETPPKSDSNPSSPPGNAGGKVAASDGEKDSKEAKESKDAKEATKAAGEEKGE